MAQEDHILGGSYNSGGGGGGSGGGGGGGSSGGASCCSSSRSKKAKQKKVPQRGLGVAQLERIREEQQKKEALEAAANLLARNAISSSSNDVTTDPCLAVQSPKSMPSVSPFPPNALYRHSSSLPDLDILHENSVQTPNRLEGGGVANWPGLCSSEQVLDHHGFAFRPSQVNLQYEPTAPVSALPGVPLRSHQSQKPSFVSSMVNSPSVISPRMEPPSNQSSHGNNCTPSWPEEGDKVVGVKRSYPFSLESPPAPSFRCTPEMEPRHKYMREGPSNSSPVPSNRVFRDGGRLVGDFLTLAPPDAVNSRHLNSRHKDYLDCSSEFECKCSEENARSHIPRPGPSESTAESFTFFPTRLQADQTTDQASSGSGENRENIDLNLKL